MNRTLKDATAKPCHYEPHDQVKQHLHTFLMAHNLARKLMTLRGLTPYEYICQQWQKDPERFHPNPHRHIVGLNT